MRYLPARDTAAGRAIAAFGAGVIAGVLAGAPGAPGYPSGIDGGFMDEASSWLTVAQVSGAWGALFAILSIGNSLLRPRRR